MIRFLEVAEQEPDDAFNYYQLTLDGLGFNPAMLSAPQLVGRKSEASCDFLLKVLHHALPKHHRRMAASFV